MIKLYIAKDSEGLKFFNDKPDRVNFILENVIKWQGYPINENIYKKYSTLIIKKFKNILNNITIVDDPICILIDKNNINII